MNLPVYEIQEALCEPFARDEHKRVLLQAPTGSGKSTAVPQMLLDQSLSEDNEDLIVVIQPRRIAARMLAQRVAQIRGTRLGQEIGYVARFEHHMSQATRVVYVTDGIFQNWLKENPMLKGISTVIFDEFHERRVASDIALAKCLKLQETDREDFQVVVMSATLSMEALAEYMEPCRQLEAQGRTYPVEISYQSGSVSQNNSRSVMKKEAVWDKCYAAVRDAIKLADCGHVLVFLPGIFEINKTVRLLQESSHFKQWKICPLYSSLSPKQQDEAVSTSTQPKIIISTNVAETSLTIDGVRTVIDAGLARVSEFDPLRGIETLMIKPVSQASADQRAGRAGRTAEGRCVRLWSQTNQVKRDAFERPEIQRIDLSEVVLKLYASGFDPYTFHWLDAPSDESLKTASDALHMLSALEDNEITERGRWMAQFSLSPRFARLLDAGVEESCLSEAAFIAAVMQGESMFLRRKGAGQSEKSDFLYDGDGSDFAGEYRAYVSAESVGFDPKRCTTFGVLAKSARECSLALKQIIQQLNRLGVSSDLLVEGKSIDFTLRADAVSLAGVKAFGDRLGKRLSTSTLSSRLVDGRKGVLDKDSVVKDHDLFIPTSITEVEGKEVVTRMGRCIGMDLELLRERFPEDFKQEERCEFDQSMRRVVSKKVSLFKGLVIEEKQGGAPDADMASAILAERVASGELILKNWDATVERWIARLLGLRDWMPELELPGFGEEDRALALEQVCQGAVSYKEIKNAEVLPAVRSWLSAGQQAALDAYAPEKITLNYQNAGKNADKGGHEPRKVKVYYEVGKTPWIAMTAQRLIGVNDTPTIANGALKLNVHICAPNNRPWQVTNDLENFWKTGFEQMRKDLAGRYPKHQWEL